MSGRSATDHVPPGAALWEPPEISDEGMRPARRLPTAAEIEAIEEEARKNGFEAGYAEGHELGRTEAEKTARAKADKKLHQAVAALESVAHSLSDSLAQSADALEPELFALVTLLARRVVQAELETRPEIIELVLRQALEQLPGRQREIRVYLHPQDHARVEHHAEQFDPRIHWVVDASLAPGGCRLEAGPARVDASLEQRLEQALEALWGDASGLESPDLQDREGTSA